MDLKHLCLFVIFSIWLFVPVVFSSPRFLDDTDQDSLTNFLGEDPFRPHKIVKRPSAQYVPFDNFD